MTTKLHWLEGPDKIWSTNGSVEYRISRTSTKDLFLAKAAMEILGMFRAQYEAIRACNEYEREINE